MLHNIKRMVAILAKELANRFGIELQNYQTNELVSRMLGFSGHEATLRGIGKINHRLFEGKVLHGVASAHYFSGEDEVCYLLWQILNLHYAHCFTVEMRGTWRRIGQQSAPETLVVRPSEERSQSPDYLRPKLDSARTPYLSSPANELIAYSRIFREVLLFEHRDNDRSRSILHDYISANHFQSGIVSTGEGGRWEVLKDTSARTDYSLAYHLAISNTYASGNNPSRVIKLLESLKTESPNALIVAWIFEDDCASGMRGAKSREQIIVQEHEVPQEKQTTAGWKHVENLGLVRRHAHEFFTGIMKALCDYDISFVRVPHYSGERCFVTRDFNESEPTPQWVRERDAIMLKVIHQIELLNLSKASVLR